MSASTVPLAWQRPAGPLLKAGSRREGEPSAEALGLQGVLSLFCFLLCVYNGCASDDGKGKEPPRKRGSRLAVLVTAVCLRANSRAPLGSAPGSTPPRGPQGACQPQPCPASSENPLLVEKDSFPAGGAWKFFQLGTRLLPHILEGLTPLASLTSPLAPLSWTEYRETGCLLLLALRHLLCLAPPQPAPGLG